MNSLTTDEMIQVFGNPYDYLFEDGNVSHEWETRILTSIRLPNPLRLAWDKNLIVNKIRCHYLIAKFLETALNQIFTSREAWNTIGDFGGCYSFRSQRNSKNLSKHCWATAIDIDVKDNPFGSKVTNVHPFTIERFEANGFIWGGTFSEPRTDGMHFEFADLTKLGR